MPEDVTGLETRSQYTRFADGVIDQIKASETRLKTELKTAIQASETRLSDRLDRQGQRLDRLEQRLDRQEDMLLELLKRIPPQPED